MLVKETPTENTISYDFSEHINLVPRRAHNFPIRPKIVSTRIRSDDSFLLKLSSSRLKIPRAGFLRGVIALRTSAAPR